MQAAAIIVAPVVLTVVIVARIADQPDSYITWGVFAALLVSGITTTLQAVRGVGRVGSGHVLIMGTSGAFIAVCVAALTEAGPSTMASLIVISSLFQFLLASRLSLLRRIFTPVVSGTVIMLIAATVMPVVFDTLHEVPEGVSEAAAPVSAGVTILVVAGMVLRAPPAWRLWSPIVGDSGGVDSGRTLRAVRRGPGTGRFLGGGPGGVVAGHRRNAGERVLGAAPRFRGGHAGGGD